MLQETDSGVITLNDDPEFADAIHCMVSYFYKANYRPSEYDTSESLLHAQVAIMADKYDCASLFELARSSFANAVKGVEIEDWIAIATLIYEHMPTDLESHVEFRGLVISAVVERPDALSEFLEKDSIVGLLRSNADMATDLLLASPKTEFSQYIFTCTDCGYMHVGPRNCSYVESNDGPVGKRPCPRCGQYSGGTSEVCFDDTDSFEAFPCSCGGFQNQKPEYKFPWEM